MWPLLITIAILIYMIIRNISKKQSYFEDRGIKVPPYKWAIGHFWETVMDTGALNLQKWTKEYGSVYGIYEGVRPIYSISDLDMLNDIFTKKFSHFHGRKEFAIQPDPESDFCHLVLARGLRWKRLRAIISPKFSVSSLKSLMPLIDECSNTLMSELDKHRDGKPFNIYDLYQAYTMDVIARLAFAENETVQGGRNQELVDLCIKNFQPPTIPIIKYMMALASIFPKAMGVMFKCLELCVPKEKNFGFLLIDRIQMRVNERKKYIEEHGTSNAPKDFITLFLEAETEDGIDADTILELKSDTKGAANFKNVAISKQMTSMEISLNLFLFMLAGFDTTSNALAYITYLLATHPDVQVKVQEELDRAEVECNGDWSYEIVNRLTYLEMVIKETLRLYPLASLVNARECMSTVDVGNVKNQLQMETGAFVWSDTWSIHHSKEIWGDDADDFRPERFLEKVVRHPMAWIPFGAGPRICVGLKLAMLEIKIELAKMLTHYNIKQCAETEVPLQLSGIFTVNPANGVFISLENRQ